MLNVIILSAKKRRPSSPVLSIALSGIALSDEYTHLWFCCLRRHVYEWSMLKLFHATQLLDGEDNTNIQDDGSRLALSAGRTFLSSFRAGP